MSSMLGYKSKLRQSVFASSHYSRRSNVHGSLQEVLSTERKRNKVLQTQRGGNSQLPRGSAKDFMVEVTFVLKSRRCHVDEAGKDIPDRGVGKSSVWLRCRAVVFKYHIRQNHLAILWKCRCLHPIIWEPNLTWDQGILHLSQALKLVLRLYV